MRTRTHARTHACTHARTHARTLFVATERALSAADRTPCPRMRDSAHVEDNASQGDGNPSNHGSAVDVSTPVCPQRVTPN
eukprot:10207426-Alexandrium_andersonii.AAC.1